MEFDSFDSRGYRTVDVRTGYGQWVKTYEDTVQDEMDIAVLDDLKVPQWSRVTRALDLGCGTGRTGAWLRRHGVTSIDGVDLTPEMLEAARLRGAHDTLREGDVTNTGLPDETYDLLIASLIDEHLTDLGPLYREAFRVAAPDALFALVGLHPHFIMASGMPTHFTTADGESIAISTTVHLISDHVSAALSAGWRLAELREAVVDDRWVALKPKWAKYRNHPVSAAYVFHKEK
ncbi:class I SAM-dependent methyltransferase [Amycolatopsis sp. 195334CR]|uniref:class I SAM-dependent DNA methyltransferase n=1 Tax=Amycolatopsis sp. 195334CR TaxID=2814588 RepID=UPI001A8ED8AA|nr:class I SAM-dependent methyltransferase [Amycolatopsis sp. 195334CR]MBN6035772.1 class I SAM-dependent methyltransferase [Amycolatopsis sp. 195334CR]